ncbi:alpha/beta fold hydrolase [Kribbella sp. NPDC055071]
MNDRDAALGEWKTANLPGGQVAYAERGSGVPVVFIHGLLANANLWRKVVPEVAEAGFRCIAADWPLGGHRLPFPAETDLTPVGVADLIAQFLAELELVGAIIVANDTGGALAQILMANHPERIGRVVLTPCDAFEEFFPKPFDQMPRLVRIPGALWLAGRLFQSSAVRRLPNTFGILAKRGVPDAILDSYVQPIRDSGEIRRDAKRFISGVHRRDTLAAAERLAGFDKPVLIVRADEDRIFAPELFERLAAALPNATLVTVADSWTFIPEDQPSELAQLIVNFAR